MKSGVTYVALNVRCKLPGNYIYFMADVPHLIKTVRNAWYNSQFARSRHSYILYQKIRLRRPIHHTKLYAHTCNEHPWREDRSLTSVIQLSMWVLYYRDPITFCTSIIESFEVNCPLLFFSITEKSRQNFFHNL